MRYEVRDEKGGKGEGKKRGGNEGLRKNGWMDVAGRNKIGARNEGRGFEEWTR
jgi:hypothetical protein